MPLHAPAVNSLRIKCAPRSSERGFTVLEVLVAIVVTSVAVVGVTGAILGALHTQANHALTAMLDDDALAVLSDVRVVSEYDPLMLAQLRGKTAKMTRILASGVVETITVNIVPAPVAPPATAGGPSDPTIATAYATAVAGPASAIERITLYEEAPTPGSVVNQ